MDSGSTPIIEAEPVGACEVGQEFVVIWSCLCQDDLIDSPSVSRETCWMSIDHSSEVRAFFSLCCCFDIRTVCIEEIADR